jgi:hypothetical protein
VGWRKNLEYLRIWHDRVVANSCVGASSNYNIHSVRNQSLANGVYLWRLAASDTPAARAERVTDAAVPVVLGVALLGLATVAGMIGRRDDPLDQAAAFGLACGATLIVSPLAWGHYYMVEGPALLTVPLWLTRRRLPRTALAFAFVPAALSWAHYLAMPLIGPLGLLGLGTTAWFLAACGLIVGVEILRVGSGGGVPHRHGPERSTPKLLGRPRRSGKKSLPRVLERIRGVAPERERGDVPHVTPRS